MTRKAARKRSRNAAQRLTFRTLVASTALAGFTPSASATTLAAALDPRQDIVEAVLRTWSARAAQKADAFQFSIPAGPLSEVLAAFERATGVKVTLAIDTIGSVQSPGVSGTLTIEQALQAIVAGTGVQFRMTSASAAFVDLARPSEQVDVTGRAPEAVISSPKYTQPLRDTPQTLVVIPQSVLQDQGATTLRDALRNTPGITLTAGEGGTAPGDNLLIRGFSARNDVYIDGARDTGVVSRDTFNVEAVEVAKGPSSVTAGRGSTGGSVNLVTKTANLQNFASGRVTAGNADYKRTTLDVNRRLGETVAFRLNGMWQDAGVPGRDEVTQKGWGFAPSVGFGLGTRTDLTISYQHLQQNNLPDYGLPGTLPDLAVAGG